MYTLYIPRKLKRPIRGENSKLMSAAELERDVEGCRRSIVDGAEKKEIYNRISVDL